MTEANIIENRSKNGKADIGTAMPRSFVVLVPARLMAFGLAIGLVPIIALSVSAPARAHDPIDPPTPLGGVSQWFSGDNYPPAAMRAGQEGNVSVTLSISAQGLVTGCQVTSSSGVPALDAKTCLLATRRGRFAPAKQGNQAVASTYDLRGVEWRIRDMSVHVPSLAPQAALSGAPPIGAVHPHEPVLAVPLATTRSEADIIAYSVKVKSDGTFGACTLTPSTGSVERDNEACRLLTTKLLKKPAIDQSGRPAQSSVSGSLRWRVPRADHALAM